MNRKERRTAAASQRKAIKKAKRSEDAVAEKMALFGHLPDTCMTCTKPFDKTNREMVMTWHVAVRESEEKVNLYCPSCWQKALDIIESMSEQLFNTEETAEE